MGQWRKGSPDEVYSAEEISQRLQAELPVWYFEDGWIRRKYMCACLLNAGPKRVIHTASLPNSETRSLTAWWPASPFGL